jgi:hypothetical protein
MQSRIAQTPSSIAVEYAWRAGRRWHRMHLRGVGTPTPAAIGSEEQFIIEHYWGYTRRTATVTHEYEVAHPSWNLWPVRDYQFDCDAAQLYGPAFASTLAQRASSMLLADGSPVSVYPGSRIAANFAACEPLAVDEK